jgi:hypothetical protein
VISVVVTSCAIALAACGSTKPATTAASLNPSAATAQRAALRFAQCMRAHGVTNFPDPTANGQSPTSDHVNKRSLAFQTAVQACHPQMTAMADLKPKTSHAQELREAADSLASASVVADEDVAPACRQHEPGLLRNWNEASLIVALALGQVNESGQRVGCRGQGVE